jgi:SPP1 Gp6-like portal protein
MPMSKSDARSLVTRLLPEWRKRTEAANHVDRWYRNELDDRDKPSVPLTATRELRGLRDRALTPWLRFVVESLTQLFYVEGYRRSDIPDNLAAWDVWQRNGMDGRQVAIHRDTFKHGVSYVTVLPGDEVSVLTGRSSRRMCAWYEDPSRDDWPLWAIDGQPFNTANGRGAMRFKLYDDEAIYLFHANDRSGDDLTYIELSLHDAGVPPVVRYTSDLDLDGRSDGEVEPNIGLASRIHQDTFDRLVVQRFGAWVVRYATGLAKPETDEEVRAQKLRISIEDVLVTESTDAKFGTLQATQIDGYIKSEEQDIRELAVVTQTPPADMLGEMVNVSAEGLAAAEAGRQRKAEAKRHPMGEGHEQVLRLAQHYRGDEEGANDFAAQVVWRDVESRSLAQVADAFGKLATMLGVPPEALWERIPGVTMTDVERWRQLRDERDAFALLLNEIDRGLGGSGGDVGAGAAGNAGA